MAFLDKLNEFTKNVGEMASDALENSRKGSRITEENKKIKECKIQLGDILYEKFKLGEITDENIISLCNNIKAAEQTVAEIQAELDAAKIAQEEAQRQAEIEENEKIQCSNCGADVKIGVKFCPECGQKIEQANKRFCIECGAELKNGASFCGECGARQ